MKTAVGLRNESRRKLPWLTYWWGDPDHETGRQRKYSKSFKYKADAKAFQAKKQAEFDAGAPRDKPEDVTLGRLLDEFETNRLAGLSHSSKCCYARTIQQLRGHFGSDRPIKAIEQRHTERFMVTRKRMDGRRGELSSWSRAQHHKQASAMFNAAIEWGYLDRNPFKPSKSGGSSPLRIKPKSGPWHHLTPQEFAAFMAEVPTARQRATFWVMYGCGCRPGEVYNLTVDRIDLDLRRVFIENRAATDDVPPFKIKANDQSSEGKARSIPIPEAAMPDLVEAMGQGLKAGGFVALSPERFETVQGNWRMCAAGKPWGGREEHRPWLNRDMMNNVLRDAKRYMRKAGIELTAPFTLTTFRKSFGQNHADAGTPPRTLAKLLGHSDVGVTMQFYNRVTDANEQAAAAVTDRIFAKATQQRTQRDVS